MVDTNVLLDWLVFADRSSGPLSESIVARHTVWLASPAMVDELLKVLERPLHPRWEESRKRALTLEWRRLASLCPEPGATTNPRLRCRDPDDQKFIDLATEQRARWLISRDRDLLALRRAAVEVGLIIGTPARWQPLEPAPPSAS